MNYECDIPDWLADLLPQPKQPTRVFLDNTGLVCAEHPDGSISTFGEDLLEANDVLKSDDTDLVYADEVYQRFSRLDCEVADKEDRAIWIPVDDGKAYRMIYPMTDDDRYHRLKWAWEEFQELDSVWRTDASFYNSWNWLDTHPAFWTRSYSYWSDTPKWKESMLWDWETEGYCQKIYVLAMHDEDGHVLVALELGAHVPNSDKYLEALEETVVVTDTYLEHYHDYRLNSYAATYEEAIIMAAKNVDKFFNTDGSEKHGVFYEPTEIEKELAKRIEETDEYLGPARKHWRESRRKVAFADYGTWLREHLEDL